MTPEDQGIMDGVKFAADAGKPGTEVWPNNPYRDEEAAAWQRGFDAGSTNAYLIELYLSLRN